MEGKNTSLWYRVGVGGLIVPRFQDKYSRGMSMRTVNNPTILDKKKNTSPPRSPKLILVLRELCTCRTFSPHLVAGPSVFLPPPVSFVVWTYHRYPIQRIPT
ncbi:hypothetical protein QCA50_016397 [Cerrena zonata]|uniref:Uncharacterized protein n=1 Tax=Cerrena zonata TaxID=2478898 RepID=A0AAW0FNN3_9APHY